MRILLVNGHARLTGGADVHCFDLQRLLTARGHEVRMLSTLHPENLPATGTFVPLTVDRGSRGSLTPGTQARVASLACWNPTVAAAANRVLADFQPDLVHAHKLYPQLSVAPIVAASRNRIPIVQTAHDYEFVSASAVDDSGARIDRDEERASYRVLNSVLFAIKRRAHVPRISAWVTVSADLADVYRREGRIESFALPNFVTGGEASASGERRSGALYVGRLATEKGIDHVIGLARRRPELPVTVAGDGPLADDVRAAATTLPNLEFVGPLPKAEVDGRMRSACLVLMPAAWREPAGLVAVEAMRAGTPVIAYDRGGLAEYVRTAGAGLVIQPGLDHLVVAVDALLADPDLWQRLSGAGVEAACGAHAPDAYLDRLESVYGTVTSDRTVQHPAAHVGSRDG